MVRRSALGGNYPIGIESRAQHRIRGVYTADGRPFAAYWRDGKARVPQLPPIPKGRTEAHRSTGKDVVPARSRGFQAKPIGIAYIQSDLRRLNARLQRYMVIAAIVPSKMLIGSIQLSHRNFQQIRT